MTNFSRFTDRARKVFHLANQEAQRFNHEYVGTEHVLLGLVKEGSGVAANVLRNLEVDLRTVRLETEKLISPGPTEVLMGRLPHTPNVKRACEFAVQEAQGLKHNYVGTEHVLLGLIRCDERAVSSVVLKALGVTPEKVREEMNLVVGKGQDFVGGVDWSTGEVGSFVLFTCRRNDAAAYRKLRDELTCWLAANDPQPKAPDPNYTPSRGEFNEAGETIKPQREGVKLSDTRSFLPEELR